MIFLILVIYMSNENKQQNSNLNNNGYQPSKSSTGETGRITHRDGYQPARSESAKTPPTPPKKD